MDGGLAEIPPSEKTKAGSRAVLAPSGEGRQE